MIKIITIIVLKVLSIDGRGLIPNSFTFLVDPMVHQENIDEAILIACNKTWSILATIPIDGRDFPAEFFTLNEGLVEFQVEVMCSMQEKFSGELDKVLLISFSSPTCEKMNPGMSDDPIIFQLNNRIENRWGLKITRVTKCVKGDKFEESDVNIGYVNNNIWYLLYRNRAMHGVIVGLMIFGRGINKNALEEVVIDTMSNISASFFNNTLVAPYEDLQLRKNDSTCVMKDCYQVNRNQGASKVTGKLPESQEKTDQFKLILFLAMAIPAGMFLIGIVICIELTYKKQ